MKKCKFIKSKKKIYIPPPGNWLEGWARQRWLERYFKDNNVLVVDAESWADLAKEKKVYTLVEKSGKFSVEKK